MIQEYRIDSTNSIRFLYVRVPKILFLMCLEIGLATLFYAAYKHVEISHIMLELLLVLVQFAYLYHENNILSSRMPIELCGIQFRGFESTDGSPGSSPVNNNILHSWSTSACGGFRGSFDFVCFTPHNPLLCGDLRKCSDFCE